MAMSEAGRDILALLPRDTYVDIETDDGIEFEVPREHSITGTTIARMCNAFQNGKAESVRCSIDFSHSAIRLKKGGVVIVEQTHLPSGLTGSTEGERAAIRVADNMGVIDHDDLVPVFTMDTTDTHIRLHIQGLINVCHDALVYYLQGQPSHTLEYDMARSRVTVLLPRVNKRKR
jgi:hypothetical protein